MMCIVAATDFSTGSDHALSRALLLARAGAGQLVLAHVVRVGAGESDAQDEFKVRLRLEAILAPWRDSGDLACTAEVRVGDPPAELAALARDVSADLLVIGPHARRPLRDLLGDWTATHVLRQANCPVMIANSQVLAPHRHALIATDFSDSALYAAATARRLVGSAEADITLYHAFDPLPYGGVSISGMAKADRLADLASIQDAAERNLAEFAKASGQFGASRHSEPMKASAATMILAHAARAHADLIVVGTTGKSVTERFILGSVAEELSRQTDVDLLLVPLRR